MSSDRDMPPMLMSYVPLEVGTVKEMSEAEKPPVLMAWTMRTMKKIMKNNLMKML